MLEVEEMRFSKNYEMFCMEKNRSYCMKEYKMSEQKTVAELHLHW
jgi:hypothetical protein